MECLKCGYNLDGLDFPFGDTIECPSCHAHMTTDWDYFNSDDDRVWWITGVIG